MTGRAAEMTGVAILAAGVLLVAAGAAGRFGHDEDLDRPSYGHHLAALVVLAAVALVAVPLTLLVVAG